jgi:hypothetical protein
MVRAWRIFSAASAVAAALLFAATSAFAHSDQGAMTAEARPGAQQMTVTARARVVFANDGHAANEAAVTVSGSGPGGAQVGPTALPRVDDGEYEALVPVPAAGDWSFQLDSANPTATATAATTVAAPQATTPPSLGSAKRATRSDDGGSSGLNASVFAIGGGAVVVAALVGGTLVIRRRR